jgi:DNA-binding MarR family transcriptional regulator
MVIDNLEKRELAARIRGETDRRSYRVSLTDKGEHLIKSIFPLHSRRINNRMSVLTVDEQKALGVLLKKLGRHRN